MLDGVEVSGLAGVKRAIKALTDDAATAIRDAAREVATGTAGKITQAGRADPVSPQSALVAETVKASKTKATDAVVRIGGAKRVGRNRVQAGSLVYGAEFGTHYFAQFNKPYLGPRGSWAIETWQKSEADMLDQFERLATRATVEFGSGR